MFPHHRAAKLGHESFVAVDRELDRATLGPVWLKDRRVAGMLVEALQYGASVKQWYALHAYVIMPNHVHVIWTPQVCMSRILQWLKGATARRAKRLLRLTANAFWQDESYDRWIRSEANPVKGGLARSEEEWHRSSAFMKEMRSADDKIVRATKRCRNAQSPKAGRAISQLVLSPTAVAAL